MEQRVDTVIFAVKIDNTEAVKQSADLAKEIDELVIKQQEMVAQGEKNTAQFIENASALRILKKEQTDLNRNIDNSAKSFMQASGSINQMRANLSNMTQQYNKLSKEERENTAVGGKLQKQMKAVSDELKKQEGAVGDNRRSVGGYTTALNLFGDKFKLFGVDLNNIKDKLKATKEGFDTAKSGFSSFDGIIKASAFGVLLTIFTGLVAVFSKFDPVVEKVEQAFAGLKAAFDVFVGALIEFGNGYIKVVIGYFNGLYEIMQGIGKFMTGDFSAGIDQMSNSMNGAVEGLNQMRGAFDGVGDSMSAAASAAAALTKRYQELEDAERALIVSNAEAQKNIDQLILKSKNRTLSEKERLAFLAQASKIEREQYAEQKRLAEEGYEIAFELARNKTKLSKEELNQLILNTGNAEVLNKKRLGLSDDELTKLAELQASKIELQSQSINVEEKISNRRDALLQQGIEAREKAEAAQVKAVEEAKKKIEELNKLRVETQQKQLELESQIADARLENIRKEYTEAQLLFEKKINNLLREGEADAELKSIMATNSIEFYDAERQKIEAQYQTKLNAMAQAEATDSEYKLAEAQRIKDLMTLDQMRTDLALSQASTIIGALGSINAATGNSAEASKGIAVASATIDTYTGATKAFAQGGVLGFITGATIIAAGLANVAKIISTDIPTPDAAAAGGGTFYTSKPTLLMVGDNPSGRERVTVEPLGSRGTTVFNKNSGLVKMAGGGTMISDGGATFDKVSSAGNAMFDIQQMIKSMPAPIVKVSDINRVERNRARTVKVSELS